MSIKFKPWGAINLAKGLNGILSGVGVVLEVVDGVHRLIQKDDFEKAVKEMDSNFAKQQKELLDLINAPNFINDFFPRYKAFEENIAEMAKVIEEQKDEGHAFKAWKQKGEIIEKELKLLEKNSL